MLVYSVIVPDTIPTIYVDETESEEIFCSSGGVAYGSYIFPACLSLSEYLLENTELFCNKRVLEIGTGFGLAGMVCGRHGASSVLLTDGLSKVVDTLPTTILNNDLQDVVTASLLKWQDLQDNIDGTFDLIIASDVTYTTHARYIPALVARYLSDDGKCIMVHEERQIIELDTKISDLKEQCAANGLCIEATRCSFKNMDAFYKYITTDANLYYSEEQLKMPEKIPFTRFTITKS